MSGACANHQFFTVVEARAVADFPLSLRIYDELTIAEYVGNTGAVA
jgi:hypothetical protein